MNDRSRVSRRTILRGAGVALALPWLESLAPRRARGQTPPVTRTYVAMTFPCGAADYWKPKTPGTGDAWSLSPILAPLAPVKPWVNVLANVGNYGPFGGHIEPSNSNLTAALLTCTRAIATAQGQSVTCGTSVDQVIAQGLGAPTKLDSMQVGLSTLDSYTDGLPAACSRSISWRSPTDPTFKVIDPQAVFDQIVGPGGLSTGVGAALASLRRDQNKSVLDFVLGHAATVRARLGSSDGVRMDGFLDSVRALETKIQALPALPSCSIIARPTEPIAIDALPPDYNRDTHANLMIDLIVMALECDVTRVVSLMMDDARSDFVYDFVPPRHFTDTTSVPDPTGPPLTGLYGMNAAGPTYDGYATANFWFVEKLALLAQKLLAIPSAAGTMLDDTTISLASEMHGPNHDGLDLPLVVVGKGGGRLLTNQFIDFAKTPRQTERLANLYFTFIRDVFGLNVVSFGGAPPPPFPPPTGAPANAYGAGTAAIPEILA
jgi:Protein of unknown function (DUF1552)